VGNRAAGNKQVGAKDREQNRATDQPKSRNRQRGRSGSGGGTPPGNARLARISSHHTAQ